MPDLTKIATCSYCGTRSVLRLAGTVQHELACASCGARLHTLKAMPVTRPAAARIPAKPAPRKAPAPHPLPRRKDKRDKRRSPFYRLSALVEDLWDEVEDLFD